MLCKQVYLQEGVYGHHTLHTILGAVLMASTLVLLANLHIAYQSHFAEQQQIIGRLLRRNDTGGSTKEKATVLLPVYYTIVLCSSFLFSFEGLLIFIHPKLASQPTMYHIYHHLAFAFSAFLDNWVLLHLIGPFTKRHFLFSFLIAGVISLCYIVFVHSQLDGAQAHHCVWCGVRYPVPEIEVPYFLAFLVYLGVAVIAKLKPLTRLSASSAITKRSYFSPRPAALIWCV
jgi:hypothetical protein